MTSNGFVLVPVLVAYFLVGVVAGAVVTKTATTEAEKNRKTVIEVVR